ncbi:MAG TPA: hypothetical protein DDY25_05475, partial [Peptococcaceae bacterium]|nr:hypothetical protein [Peptococcaceae bacterium]
KCHSTEHSKKRKNKLETPKATELKIVKNEEQQKVHLEFPYDDLELLYEYTLKELGIKDPFK